MTDYSNYNYSEFKFREMGSRKAYGIEDIQENTSDEKTNSLASIVKDLSAGAISVEQAVEQIKGLGIDVQEVVSPYNVTISFQYNGKNYSITAVKTKTFEETINEYDANYIADYLEAGLNEHYDPNVSYPGLEDDLVNFIKELCGTKAGVELKNIIGGRSIEDLVKGLMREVPVNDFTTIEDFIEGFKDLIKDIMGSNPSRINIVYQNVENDRNEELRIAAEEAARQAEEQARLEEESRLAQVQEFYDGLEGMQFNSYEELVSYIDNSEYAVDTIIEQVSVDGYYTTYNVYNSQDNIHPAAVTVFDAARKAEDDRIAEQERLEAEEQAKLEAEEAEEEQSTETPTATRESMIDEPQIDSEEQRLADLQEFYDSLEGMQFNSYEELVSYIDNSEYAADTVIESASVDGNTTTYNIYNSQDNINAAAVTIINTSTTENVGEYAAEILKENYKLTDVDINVFFENKDGKYVIKESAVKNCFARDDIKTVEDLLEAMKNDGFSEGYVRGAYNLSAEDVEKYLTKIQTYVRFGEDPTILKTRPYYFKLNEEALDLGVSTLGQLKDAIQAIKDMETSNTDNDTRTTTTTETSEQGTFSEGIIKGQYAFKDEEVDEFFTINENGEYVLNQDALKAAFPEEEITTLDDLKAVIEGYGYVSVISEKRKQSTLEDFKTAFINSDDKWGFGNMKPNEELVETIYQTICEDNDIVNFSGKISEFKELIKTKANELIEDVKNSITVYNEGELFGKYSLSNLEVNLFFDKNEDGTYTLNMDKVNDFWGGYQRDTIEKIIDFDSSYPLGYDRSNKAADTFIETIVNGDLKIKELFDPPLTDKEIQGISNAIKGLDRKNKMTLKEYNNAIMENFPLILNRIQIARIEGKVYNGELEDNASYEDTMNAINEYADRLRTELNSWDDYHGGYKCNFSPAFIDDIIQFAIKDLNISPNLSEEEILAKADERRRSLQLSHKIVISESGVITTQRFSDEEIEQQVADYINKLRTNNSNNINELLDQFKHSIDLLTSYGLPPSLNQYIESKDGSSHKKCINESDAFIAIINQMYSSDDIRDRYFAKLFGDFFDTKNLSESEQNAYINMIAQQLYEDYIKLNQYDNEVIDLLGNIEMTTVFSLYNYSEWFSQLKSSAGDINHIDDEDINNATSISDYSLIVNKSPKYIFEHLDEMLLSNDPGVRKFAKMINEFLTTITKDPDYKGIYQDKNLKQNYIKWLMVFLNKEFGQDDPANPKLSKEILDNLGSNIFEKMSNIFNSKAYQNAAIVDIDGVIGDFRQGSFDTNNCWLLSGIAAINSSPAGKALFKSAIKWNSDYTAVTVTIPGTGDSVTISAEEIIKADPDFGSGKYNYGDNDVLAIVLAWGKLHDMDPDTYRRLDGDMSHWYSFDWANSDSFTKVFLPNPDCERETAGGIDDLFSLVSGDKVDMPGSDIRKYLYEIYKLKVAGKNVAATFCFFTSGTEDYTWRTVDNKTGKAPDISGGHVLAITDIGYNTVTFVNPWNSAEEYTVTWDTFAYYMGVAQMAWSTWD